MSELKFDITGDNTKFLAALEEAKRGITATIDQLAQSGGKVDASLSEAGQKVSESVKKTGEEAGKSIDTATEKVDELGKEAEKTGKGMEATFQKVAQAAAGLFALNTIRQFATEVMNVRKEFESLEKSFSTLMGSDLAGKKLFADITDFATKTPMLEKDLASAAQTMLSFNIAGEEIMPMLRQLGDISMGDSQKLQSLTLAFSQMSSTGKLMGQDLLQMINAGFNPLAEISRTTGRSMKELKEDMSNGLITVEMVKDAFASATSEGGKFNGMLESLSQTLAGSISNFEGAVQKLYNDLGQAMEKPVVEGVNAATEAINFLTEHTREAVSIITGFTAGVGAYKAACVVASIATKGWSASMKELTVVTWLQEKAQKALNATMKANPYVLAATAIIALVSAMGTWLALSKKQNKEQEELNKKTQDLNTAITSEKAKIDELFNKLRKAKEGTSQYAKAKKAILDQYGSYLDGLSEEVRSLKDIEAAYKAITKAANEAARARAIQSAKEEAQKKFGEDVSKSAGGLYDILTTKLGKEKAAEKMKEINAELANTGEISEKTQKELEKVFHNSKLNDNLNTNLVRVRGYVASMNEAQKKLTDQYERIDATLGIEDKPEKEVKTNFSEDYKKAKGEYEKAGKKVKEIEANRKEYTTAQYKAAVEARETAEKAYKALGGKTTKQDEQDANKAKNLRKEKSKEAQAYSDITDKFTKERIRKDKEAELQAEQYRIDAMRESSAKAIRQIELDRKKELDAIEAAKQAAIEAHEKEARAIWEAQNPKAAEKGQTWDNTGKVGKTFSLTSSEIDMFKAREKAAEESYNTQITNQYRQDAQYMLDYLKEYGTMQEKRYAIAKEYDEKIAKLKAEGASEWEIRSYEKQKSAAISSSKATELANGIDWSQVMGGVGTIVRSIAEETLKKIDDYMKTDEYKKLSATDKKSISELRSKVSGNVNNDAVNPFGSKIWRDIDTQTKAYEASLKRLNDANKEHEKAVKDVEDAEKEFAQSLVSGDIAKQNAAAIKKQRAEERKNSTANEVASSEVETANAQRGLTDTTERLNQGLNDVVSNFQSLTSGSLFGFAKGITGLVKQLTGAGKEAEGAGSVIGGLGGKAGGLIGAILQLIDILGNEPAKFISDLLSKIQHVIEAVLSQLPEIIGNIIKGAANIIGGVFNGIAGIFGVDLSGGNEKRVAEITEENTKAIKANSERLDKLRDALDKSAGVKAVEIGDAAISIQKENNRLAMETLMEQMGYHSAHHSNEYYMDNGKLSRTYKQEIERAMKASGVELEKNIGGLDDIYKMTPEQIAAIKMYMPKTWELLTETGKYDKTEYWDDVVEQAGKLEEITEQVKENITQWSGDSLKDEFRSTLMDMDSDIDDFADHLTEKMTEAFLNIKLNEKGGLFDKLVNDEDSWFNKYYNKLKDGELTKEERKAAQEEYQKLVNEGLELRNNIAKLTGYGESASQKATANSIQSITADQADQLVGRITAMQIIAEANRGVQLEMAENITTGVDYLMRINVTTTQVNDTLNAILLQHVQSNSYLEDMTKYSKGMYNEWGEKLNKITQQLERL